MRRFLSLTIALAACVPPLTLPEGADIACVDDDECVATDYCVRAIGRCFARDDACADVANAGFLADGVACADGAICRGGACVDSVCGDGFVNVANEDCDDGDANDDAERDACRSACVFASCGDGVVDSGESCDGDVDCADGCVTDCADGRADCDAFGGNGCECVPARLADFAPSEVCALALAGAGGDVVAVIADGSHNGDLVPWRLVRIAGPGEIGVVRTGESVNCPLLAADADAAYVLVDDGAGLVVDLDGRDAVRDFVHPCPNPSNNQCLVALGARTLFVGAIFPNDVVVGIDRADLSAAAPFFATDLKGIAIAAVDGRDRVAVALGSGAVAVVDEDGAVAPVGDGFAGVPDVVGDGASLFVLEEQRLWRADLRTLEPILVDTLPPAPREGLGSALRAAHAGRVYVRDFFADTTTSLSTWDAPRGRAMALHALVPVFVVVDDDRVVYADPAGIALLPR